MRATAYVCKDRSGNKVLPGCHYWEWDTKDTAISLTLILAESTTKERNHKHPVFFFFFDR